MTVQAGYLTGGMSFSDGSTSIFWGGIHPSGRVLAFGTDGEGDDFGVFGTISGTSISGIWESESGADQTGGSSGGGGGGSGGCSSTA